MDVLKAVAAAFVIGMAASISIAFTLMAVAVVCEVAKKLVRVFKEKR